MKTSYKKYLVKYKLTRHPRSYAKAYANKPRLFEIIREQPTLDNENAVTLYETVIIEAEWSSYKERRVDALALRADERRDKLR